MAVRCDGRVASVINILEDVNRITEHVKKSLDQGPNIDSEFILVSRHDAVDILCYLNEYTDYLGRLKIQKE